MIAFYNDEFRRIGKWLFSTFIDSSKSFTGSSKEDEDSSAKSMLGSVESDTLGGAGIDKVRYESATESGTVGLKVTEVAGVPVDEVLGGHIKMVESKAASRLVGDGGGNSIFGGAGNDTLSGGGGVDKLSYASATGAVIVNLSAASASGAAGNDTISLFENIVGSSGASSLVGDSGGNSILGGAGADTIEGLGGADTLSGAGGIDTLSYLNAAGGVSVNLNASSASGAAGNDIISLFENIVGSSGASSLVGNSGNNSILGGDDTLSGAGGTDTLSYENATGAVTVNLNDSSASGAAGNDTIWEC